MLQHFVSSCYDAYLKAKFVPLLFNVYCHVVAVLNSDEYSLNGIHVSSHMDKRFTKSKIHYVLNAWPYD